jgi:hypothetical protein
MGRPSKYSDEFNRDAVAEVRAAFALLDASEGSFPRRVGCGLEGKDVGDGEDAGDLAFDGAEPRRRSSCDRCGATSRMERPGVCSSQPPAAGTFLTKSMSGP